MIEIQLIHLLHSLEKGKIELVNYVLRSICLKDSNMQESNKQALKIFEQFLGVAVECK